MSISYLRARADERGDLVRQNLKEDLAPSLPIIPTFPTLEQAVTAKNLLRSLPLPLELIESIMDFAEYWPSVTSRMKDSVAVMSDPIAKKTDFYSIMFTYHHWVKEYLRSRELFQSEPVAFRHGPKATASWKMRAGSHATHSLDQIGNAQKVALPARGNRPCRKVVFDIVSREDCKYVEEKSTWFEATLEKPECEYTVDPLSLSCDRALNAVREQSKPRAKVFDSMQSLWKAPISVAKGFVPKRKVDPTRRGTETSPIILTYNKTDTKRNHHHCLAWKYDDLSGSDGESLSDGAKFVRSMEIGDRIILYARAENHFNDTRRFYLWMNYVASASVRIYWAV
ncbi:hypothetical protein G7Y79_00072g097820 [Physcia stellaris]|nr:hypothetical protein G7Y79_00072g097820 [Physcia stellaris]